MEHQLLSLSGTRVRRIGRVNWRGLWTLYMKEVRRFLNVFTQTLLAPMVTTLLFLAVFTLALGAGRGEIGGVSFATFLAPGLVLMAMGQNARSAARRGGTEWVSTCRSRWAPYT